MKQQQDKNRSNPAAGSQAGSRKPTSSGQQETQAQDMRQARSGAASGQDSDNNRNAGSSRKSDNSGE